MSPGPIAPLEVTHVTPEGPTSGPSGFGLNVAVPACSTNTLAVSIDGSPPAFERIITPPAGGYGYPTALVSSYGSSLGPHQVTFACEPAGGGAVQWADPGFTIDVTSGPIALSVQSTTVSAGGSLVLYSGAGAGPSPCPALPGVTVNNIIVGLYPESGSTGAVAGPLTVTALNVPSVSLPVPSTLTPGSYDAEVECTYFGPPVINPNVGEFWFGLQTVTVTS